MTRRSAHYVHGENNLGGGDAIQKSSQTYEMLVANLENATLRNARNVMQVYICH